MAQFLTLLSILLLVAVFNPDKYESSALAVPGSEEDGVDYFPIQVKESDGNIVQHECLETDDSSLYCTKLRNYPDKNEIEQLINEKYPHLKSYFNQLEPIQNISYRMSVPSAEYLCNTFTTNIFPEAVKDEDDLWLIIPQMNGYKQGFIVEKCAETDEICGESMGLKIPKQYKATCKQHYVRRAFLAQRSAKFMRAEVKIPSCCKCDLIEI